MIFSGIEVVNSEVTKPVAADSQEMQAIVENTLESFLQKEDFTKGQNPISHLKATLLPDSRQKELFQQLQSRDLVVFGVHETNYHKMPSLNRFHFKISTYGNSSISLERMKSTTGFSAFALERGNCKNFLSSLVLENLKRKQSNRPLILILFLLNVWKGPEQKPWTTAKGYTGSELRRLFKLTTINPELAELIEQNILFAYPYFQQANPASFQIKVEDLTLTYPKPVSLVLFSLPFVTTKTPWQTEEWKTEWAARKNPKSHTHWKEELLGAIARFKEQGKTSDKGNVAV